MYFMGEMSLRSGIPNTPQGFTFNWEFTNYTDALAARLCINNGFTLRYWEHAFSVPDLTRRS